jgi:hypothetical protein
MILTAALAAAVSLFLGFTAPRRALDLGAAPPLVVTGGYHVHSNRSDGSGTVDEIASAARRAGLAFVILTDHGDGTRRPDPPHYRDGVLVIDAVEINTSAGHLVALGLDGAAPYPLAGQARDVLDDVHRLGGAGISAHPDSPSDGLRWRGGAGGGADGFEWLNVDSEWRDDPPLTLLATAARSLIRGPESIASLFSRPARSLERLDQAARQRPTFGLAALDAHASIGWRDREEPRTRSIVHRPGYEAMFRTVGQSVMLETPLSGSAAADARRILSLIRAGRSFSVVRAYASPASLTFTATGAGATFGPGDRLPAGSAATFRASVPEAPGARVAILHNGRAVATGQGRATHDSSGSPGSYRVEVTLPDSPAPWLLSNPIVIEGPAPRAAEPATLPLDWQPIAASGGTWTVERESTSAARVSFEPDAVRVAYDLASGPPRGQYAALAVLVQTSSGVERVRFVGRASRPMRVSVQFRLPGGAEGRRWRRSVYLDDAPREVTISLSEFEPVEPYTSQRPIVSPIQSLLFVVDTLNTLPGTTGTFWISKVELGLRKP